MRVVIAIVLALAAGSSWAADGDGTLNASVLTFTLGRWIDDGADSVDVYHVWENSCYFGAKPAQEQPHG